MALGQHEHLRGRGHHAGEQVEGEEAEGSHGVLHVVAVDPQEPHVAEQVQEPAVQEHAGEDGERRRPEVAHAVVGEAGDLGRDGAGLLDEQPFAHRPQAELVEEGEHVDGDDRVDHPGRAVAQRVVAEWYQHRASI
jgi:hypothetical protein